MVPIIKKRKIVGYKRRFLKKLTVSKSLVFCNSNRQFLKSFKKDVLDLYGVVPSNSGKKDELKLSPNIAKDLLYLSKYDSYGWSIPRSIMDGNEDIKREWLKTFFDAEGSPYFSKIHNCSVTGCSVNGHGIKQVKKLLEDFCIKSYLNGPYKKKGYNLVIKRKTSLLKFYKEIGFNLDYKQEKLKEIIEVYCKEK